MGRSTRYILGLMYLSVSFGLFVLLFAWTKMNLIVAVKLGVVCGLLVGVVVGGGCVVLDYFFTRRLPAEALRLVQRRVVTVKGDVEHIFIKCKKMLESDAKILQPEVVDGGKIILAETRMSWLTFGEKLEFRFSVADKEGSVAVEIHSRPRVRITFIDYGQNYRNIELYSKAIAAFEK